MSTPEINESSLMMFYDCFYKYADMNNNFLFKFVSRYNFKKTLKI